MKYEDFIYELIKLLKSWGTWNESVEIYSSCKNYKPAGDADVFRDLNNVCVSDNSEIDKMLIGRWPDKCEIVLELNGTLVNLFDYGVLVVDASDLPFEKKEEAYYNSCGSVHDYMEDFESVYNEEAIRENPEEFGLPSNLEFDSADEYELFLDSTIQELINEEKKKFIADMTGDVTFDNDLEAEICDLCDKHGLSYKYVDSSLCIGHGLS